MYRFQGKADDSGLHFPVTIYNSVRDILGIIPQDNNSCIYLPTISLAILKMDFPLLSAELRL